MLLQGKKLKEKQAKIEEEQKKQQNSKITNHTSEKYIVGKFNREFNLILQEMFHDEEQPDD